MFQLGHLSMAPHHAQSSGAMPTLSGATPSSQIFLTPCLPILCCFEKADNTFGPDCSQILTGGTVVSAQAWSAQSCITLSDIVACKLFSCHLCFVNNANPTEKAERTDKYFIYISSTIFTVNKQHYVVYLLCMLIPIASLFCMYYRSQ